MHRRPFRVPIKCKSVLAAPGRHGRYGVVVAGIVWLAVAACAGTHSAPTDTDDDAGDDTDVLGPLPDTGRFDTAAHDTDGEDSDVPPVVFRRECEAIAVADRVPVVEIASVPGGIPEDTGPLTGMLPVDPTFFFVVSDQVTWDQVAAELAIVPVPVDFTASTVVVVRDLDNQSCGSHEILSAQAGASSTPGALDLVVQIHNTTWRCCFQCDGGTQVLSVFRIDAVAQVSPCIEHVNGCAKSDSADSAAPCGP